MSIKEVRLFNFKCFQRQSFRLNNINILTGLSGTGKSVLLESLLLMKELCGDYSGSLYRISKAFGDIDGCIEIEIDDGVTLKFSYDITDYDIEYSPESRSSGILERIIYLSYRTADLGINLDAIDIKELDKWVEYIIPSVRRYHQGLEDDGHKKVYQRIFGFDGVCSLGERNAFNMIAHLLMLKSGDIVILENPEIGIHPYGQFRLGELIAYIANKGIQVILETQNEHIFNGIRLAIKRKILSINHVNLLYFYHNCMVKQGTYDSNADYTCKVDYIEILLDGRLTSQPKGLFDEWTEELLKLLSPPKDKI